ncbi:MAG: S8 family serine peptidase, partial [Gammaproteobacteria bacterium]|nr:S8 family serine peptidase [Gammaproteobacteria bacterium]
ERYSIAESVEYTFAMGVIDDATSGWDSFREISSFTRYILSIDPGKTRWRTESFSNELLEPEKLHAFRATIPHTAENGETFVRRSFVLLETDADSEVIVTCVKGEEEPTRGGGGESSTGPDPLYMHQWGIENTGQKVFSENGGTVGADINITDTLDADLYTGDGVHVAIVDTGAETCHPDLKDAMFSDRSINLKDDSDWPGIKPSDPYNPDVSGDHGTAVAGVIGAVSSNAKGVRGVASLVWLRAFNYLEAQSNDNRMTALGSDDDEAQDVDIFNLSWGSRTNRSLGMIFSDIDEEDEIFKHGTSSLRDGLGASYVKSAGNSFDDCYLTTSDSTIGCGNSSKDPRNNSPFVITVGALNADGIHARYSSAGTNLWITAPGGSSYSTGQPGIVTTDQLGLFKGYNSYRHSDYWTRNNEYNPDGIATELTGTSFSAPHVSGAIALLYQADPDLTWMDVKYLLAKTASKPEPDRVPYVLESDTRDEPLVLQQSWTENDAGYSFHNLYGFGALNVDAAIEELESYKSEKLERALVRTGWMNAWADWQDIQQVHYLQIPTDDLDGVSLEVQVPAYPDRNPYQVEGVQISTLLCPGDAEHLQIQLTSPAGTKSILVAPNDHFLTQDWPGDTLCEWVYLSTNALYRENANGKWKLTYINIDEENEDAVVASTYFQIYASTQNEEVTESTTTQSLKPSKGQDTIWELVN